MEAIGQKLITTVGQGKVPEGGRVLRTFPEYAPVELAEARRGFDTVTLLDNTAQDTDRRAGHISIDYPDSVDGAYRAHRYEAAFEGTSQTGTLSEHRHFPDAGQGKAIIDGSWTSLDGTRMTSVAYVQLEGGERLEYASLSHVDLESPERSQAVGWTRGLDSAALAHASDWQLRP